VISTIIKPNTYSFKIFDRWGEIVFESNDPNEKWDGTYYKNNFAKSTSEDVAQVGTYIWKLQFEMKDFEDVKVFTGHVNLLK
jgi:gliding motility-associated-like protein